MIIIPSKWIQLGVYQKAKALVVKTIPIEFDLLNDWACTDQCHCPTRFESVSLSEKQRKGPRCETYNERPARESHIPVITICIYIYIYILTITLIQLYNTVIHGKKTYIVNYHNRMVEESQPVRNRCDSRCEPSLSLKQGAWIPRWPLAPTGPAFLLK